MTGYTVSKIFKEDNDIYFVIDGKNTKLELPSDVVVTDNLISQYKSPGPLHIIDDQGIGVCQSLQWRPYSLPPGSRRPSQWEFDKYCYENPDPRYPLDINALVYKTYLSKNYF
tara:strand:- start:13 stop:351 length:339 start_codon:yes stop_codon:yes gene_type:complete